MKTIVYLGPSLPAEEAKKILPDAICRPPAKQSDILSDVVNERPGIIVLIDGLFHQNLSVWHKEILYALSQGIHVIGASSMGALRAVECERFGMVGIGSVFEWYQSQKVMPYDEVAVAHDEDGNPLSMPLIEVRFTLENMVVGGDISANVADRIIDEFKSEYFPDRTTLLIPEDIRDLFVHFYDDTKRSDAIEAIRKASEVSDEGNPFVPSFEMSHSHLFDAQFERDRKIKLPNGHEIPMSEIDAWAAFNDPEYHQDNWNAVNRECALVLATILGIKPTREDEEEEWSRWNISPESPESKKMIYENAAIRSLHRSIRSSFALRRNTGCFLRNAMMNGKFLGLAEEASVFRRMLEKLSPDFIQSGMGDVGENDILREISPLPVDRFMEESGVVTEQELKLEIEKRMIVYGAGK